MIHAISLGDQETNYLPARMLNEFAYCPRLFYFEHVEGLFADNADTIEGSARHKRVDKKTDALPNAADAAEKESIHARSVTLACDTHQIIAKLDLIQAAGNIATPVDYKRGSPKKLDDGSLGAWDPERIQICVQALVLRANGYQCDEGVLFFWETRQRVTIAIDQDLIQQTLDTIQQTRATIAAAKLPPPLIDSPKCPRCSLVGICLPDETRHCASDSSVASPTQETLFDLGPVLGSNNRFEASKNSSTPIRQLVTARDQRRPLYLNTQGMSIGISGQVLQIREKSKTVQTIRLNDVSQVNLFGAVQVTTQAIQALMAAEIPLLYFSFGGWFQGQTQSVGLKNIMWRREQFRMADQPRFCLKLARQWVIGKIKNQRTLLMRNHIQPPREAIHFLKAMLRDAALASDLPQLLGVEGIAARTYFEHFSGMIKVDQSDPFASPQEVAAPDNAAVPHETRQNPQPSFRFDFLRRNRRPPRDPVNALLSLGYSMLAKDLTVTCAAVGLDPFLGFYHQPRFGRPALALDLMEPFRPLIVDSAVLSAINQRMVTARDFVNAGDAVALTANGRRGFYMAYEQRMDQLVTHPLFGYRVSYRRVLEIQTRLLARVLMGEILEYPVFVTR